MHDVEIPKSHIERVIARRGKLHIFDEFDPATTALLVVDMQNAFVAPGALAEVPKARDIVPNINRIAGGLRAAGGHVIWIRGLVHSARGPWAHYLASFEKDPDMWREALRPESEGWRFWHGLDIDNDDLVVNKDRYSAFYGPDDLDGKLRERGIETVIVCGTLTSTCCESTARDAMQHDYAVIMVMDANACKSDAEHLNTMCTVFSSFGDVLTTDDIVARIESVGAAAGEAASG